MMSAPNSMTDILPRTAQRSTMSRPCGRSHRLRVAVNGNGGLHQDQLGTVADLPCRSRAGPVGAGVQNLMEGVMICDFCTFPLVAWRFEATPFGIDYGHAIATSDSGWAA